MFIADVIESLLFYILASWNHRISKTLNEEFLNACAYLYPVLSFSLNFRTSFAHFSSKSFGMRFVTNTQTRLASLSSHGARNEPLGSGSAVQFYI